MDPDLDDLDLDLEDLDSESSPTSVAFVDAHGRPRHSDVDVRPKKSPSTCSTCRVRKVRCNGARPLCSNCQRLGFPCSYEGADAAACPGSLPRRRVRQACLSCHARKARCSGHLPSCERCRVQGLECVYRPGKRARAGPRPPACVEAASPRSHQLDDSDVALADQAATPTPSSLNHDVPCSPDESFEALIAPTLDRFFRHVHHIPMYSFLHRASLMAQYAAGKVDRALLLALVGITSCLTDMGPGVREYGHRCVDEAERLVFADYTRPSTFKVQALVFIIKHRILSNNFSSAFVLFAIASRFAAALRLNHDCPSLCFLAQESRRRLVWSLYCIDLSISAGYRDFSLWRADAIHVGLPCNERNFEFDLPQPNERLVPVAVPASGADEPQPPHSEDVGSLALHVRIFHIRQRIIEFTRDALGSRSVDTTRLQATVLSLHKELDDFANRLPASFQFSENSLRLRAYSPRICVFVMIHVWWRQCHCDLYRLALAGFREALPPLVLRGFDESFVQHCQRQCLDHALAMASIFSAMQELGVKPVADLDLALCAYQCARMLKYAYHVDAHKFDLTADRVTQQAEVCLRAVRQCCTGAAAAAVASELEALATRGLELSSSPARLASPDTFRLNGPSNGQAPPRQLVLKSIEVSDDADVNKTFTSAPATKMSQLSLPSAMLTDPWPSSHDDAARPGPDAPGPRGESATGTAVGPLQLNNAYEGALDGLELDNGLDRALGVDAAAWLSGGEWAWPQFMTGGGGPIWE